MNERTVEDALAYAATYWTNPDDPITDRVQGSILAEEVVRLRAERDELRSDNELHLAAKRLLSSEKDYYRTERDELRAVVERLPKTADGVPVVPPTTLYTDDGTPVGVNCIDSAHRAGSINGYIDWDTIRWSRDTRSLYSTREAAERAAAREHLANGPHDHDHLDGDG